MLTRALNNIRNGDAAWFCIKLSFAWCWLMQITTMLRTGGACLYPAGICKLYPFDFLFATPVSWLLYILIGVLLVAYVSERFMVLTTGLLTMFSTIIISRHESTGILMRA